MLLINSKVELKLRWTTCCVWIVLGVANSVALQVLFLLSKAENYEFLSSLYQQKTTRNYQNFLAKDLKDQCIGLYTKQKVRIKLQHLNIDVFLNPTL